jgi:aromatic-L-amino-acid decarboxylase
VNVSGVAFVSHTRVHGSFAIRLAIGNAQTTRAEVERAWLALRSG